MLHVILKEWNRDMKSRQWMKDQLKEIEAEIQEDKNRDTKMPKTKSKKYERVRTTHEVYDAPLYGVQMGRREILREILDMPKVEVGGIEK
jgi:hypothetical protein